MDKSSKLSGTSRAAPGETSQSNSQPTTEKPKKPPKIRTLSSSDNASRAKDADPPSDSDRWSANSALCSRHQITQEVLLDTRPAFEALRKTEDLLIATHEKLKPAIKANEKLSSQLKTFKKGTNDPKGKHRDSDEYHAAVESLTALAHKKHRSSVNAADFLDKIQFSCTRFIH